MSYFSLPLAKQASKHVNPIGDILLVGWAIGRDMYRDIYLQVLVYLRPAKYSRVQQV